MGKRSYSECGGAAWRQGAGEMAGVWEREDVRCGVLCPAHMHAGMRRKEMWVSGYGVH